MVSIRPNKVFAIKGKDQVASQVRFNIINSNTVVILTTRLDAVKEAGCYKICSFCEEPKPIAENVISVIADLQGTFEIFAG